MLLGSENNSGKFGKMFKVNYNNFGIVCVKYTGSSISLDLIQLSKTAYIWGLYRHALYSPSQFLNIFYSTEVK